MCTDAVEIGIVGWWLIMLVDCWSWTCGIVLEPFTGWSIPCYTKAVDVVQAVTQGYFRLGRLLSRNMRYQSGKVVGMYLFGQRMVWSNQDILKQAWLRLRQVCEPTAHTGMRSWMGK